MISSSPGRAGPPTEKTILTTGTTWSAKTGKLASARPIRSPGRRCIGRPLAPASVVWCPGESVFPRWPDARPSEPSCESAAHWWLLTSVSRLPAAGSRALELLRSPTPHRRRSRRITEPCGPSVTGVRCRPGITRNEHLGIGGCGADVGQGGSRVAVLGEVLRGSDSLAPS